MNCSDQVCCHTKSCNECFCTTFLVQKEQNLTTIWGSFKSASDVQYPLPGQPARASCFVSIHPTRVLGSAEHPGDILGEDWGCLCPTLHPCVTRGPQACSAESSADKNQETIPQSPIQLHICSWTIQNGHCMHTDWFAC